MSPSGPHRRPPRRTILVAIGKVEERRGSLGHAATLRFHIPLIEPDMQISRIRLVWGCLCQGESSRDFCCPLSCHSILLFDPRRERSSVPTACFHRRRAQRQSRTAFLQRRRTRARRQAAGDRVVGRAMIRGEPAIGRDQSREPRLYSVEPVWGPDHEAVIRFCGQGSEAAGPFSQRHCSHSRMRIAATSDRHRLPSASSAVRCRTLFVLSRSRVLLTPPAAARHRPAPRRS